jgi:glycosyltransferase 2 family protein
MDQVDGQRDPGVASAPSMEVPPDRRRYGPRALRWVLAASVLLGIGWFFATRLDAAALIRALAGANYGLVLLCAAGHMALLHPLKAWRWALMLAPMQRIPRWTLFQYNLAGCAATNVLPARSGQAVRVLLVRRHGVPVAGAISAVVLEEILNASMLAVIALPLPFLLRLTKHTTAVLAFVGVGAFIALGLLVWIARTGRARPDGLWRRLADGLALLTDARAAFVVIAQTAVLWVLDAAQIALLMVAIGMPASFAGAALVLLFVNLTNAVPVTPGQVGLFEAGATAACVALGASAEQGFALGVLYHLMQAIPDTAFGAVVLARASLGRREVATEAAAG